ncbi:putative bifunctional diguanylate cyclase/phosphodiesterase [Allorhizobium taibaishanense]|uniref:Diguanylate cyclase n=1 Tax=Allorhizobium taibaishanense TaxID=887144 RepID=A0A1Q9A3U7_9HYPH|nr:EAL domain-containing protein [Allorhizobium taibaishanense]MBB4006317.1 diguanylate cyclase (GGDEF)-like protein/PAS domain S-box-containing protein [Allorhizobium taibaishanense]OLP49275.1 diguanylate cyclase [Allorhizobium taibaishanense]
MTRSVEQRFLALVAGTVFVCVVPLFILFLWLSSERAETEQQNNVAVLLAANAQALAKPLWDFDAESVRQISAALISGGEIARVAVNDLTGDIHVAMPQVLSATQGMTSLSQTIIYRHQDGPKAVGTITLSFRKHGLFASIRRTEGVFVAIFTLAMLVVILAAIVGNRMMVMKPLEQLTAAIEATRRLGSRRSVHWHSNDEMGRLAQSFNAMQAKLQQEEIELKNAHRLATDIYNATPAMLFSVDADDRITGFSDYWATMTGYARENIIGQTFASLIATEARDAYHEVKLTNTAGLNREFTSKFVCADGRVMDVLVTESAAAVSMAQSGLSLSVMTDITALKQSEARNRRQAMTDHLTGLLNRQGFETELDAQIEATDRQGGSLACLFVDLDRFKWINDNLGHHAGDTTLRILVDMIVRLLPENSIAARIGGDEFAILLRAENCEAAARAMARDICGIFETPFIVKGTATRLSASIGIALYPQHAGTAAELLQKADMAMYNRKRDGKNGLQLFDDSIGNRTRRRAELEQTIEQALHHDWFDAFLQPIVELQSGRIVGYEALMRLRHPLNGVMGPAEIIALAEENGTIHDIGKQVFDKALDHFTRLSALTGDKTSYLALNVSPSQIDASLPVWLASAVHLFDIDPSRIIIEITEATLLHDNPHIQTVLQKIGDFGCRIALDDFGTGYSSLSYLSRFPVNIIKIDQSFIRSMTGDTPELRERSRMLIEGIAAISHKMKCRVVAEGIETEDQWHAVQAIGVDFGQGYLFGRPQSFEDIEARLGNGDLPQIKAATVTRISSRTA